MRWSIVCCCVVFAVGAWAAPDPQGELIFPLQEKHCHGSSIVECPNGDLLACWFFGSGERSANDVLIQGARLAKGATAWSPVFEMADTPGFPDCNPVLYIDAKERLWLFWIPVLANRWENSLLMYRRAENYLQPGSPEWSWQDIIVFDPGEDLGDNIAEAFKHLPHDESMWGEYAPPYSRMLREAAQDKLKRQIGWMTRIHPLTLPSGRILLPLYSDGFNISLVAISDDTGETWRPSRPIIGLGPIQPTLARRNDGTIVAYMRDSGSLPKRVLKATSQDDGESWSLAANTDIPNPSSSLEVIVLEDGRWVMIFNDTEQGRHSLALAMSDDEGKTWKWKRHIEQGEPGKTGYGYPSMIQTKDGMIHVTYTFSEGQNSIKHLVIHPDWVAE
jgi:predicted neuraminidase